MTPDEPADAPTGPGAGTRPGPTAKPPGRPLDRVAYVLSIWFGCGLVPVAPGTAGTLGAIPLYLLLRGLGPGVIAASALALTLVGWWSAARVIRRVAAKDPQFICVDEVAGVFVTWIAAPPTTAGLIAGVLLFRLFDQVKPWPASAAERRLPGGAGVMFDDVAAGGWGAAVLLLARWRGWL